MFLVAFVAFVGVRATFGIFPGCHVAHLDNWFLFSRCWHFLFHLLQNNNVMAAVSQSKGELASALVSSSKFMGVHLAALFTSNPVASAHHHATPKVVSDQVQRSCRSGGVVTSINFEFDDVVCYPAADSESGDQIFTFDIRLTTDSA
jgi:hypothetical protein